jgi:hypothetical protein
VFRRFIFEFSLGFRVHLVFNYYFCETRAKNTTKTRTNEKHDENIEYQRKRKAKNSIKTTKIVIKKSRN